MFWLFITPTLFITGSNWTTAGREGESACALRPALRLLPRPRRYQLGCFNFDDRPQDSPFIDLPIWQCLSCFTGYNRPCFPA